MDKMDISIVVPTFNRPDSLNNTLESLCKQTYPKDKYEIIICDDSTTDETMNLVNKFIQKNENNIRYIKANSTTKGPANARNIGIKASLAPIVGFTDDDCIVSENWIENANQIFQNCGDQICGLYGKVTTIGDCKKNRFSISRKVCVQNDDGSYVTPNVFYKKDTLLKVGCFDVTQRYLEDIELGWRVESIGKILFCPSVKVQHQMLCISIKEYISRLRVIEYWVMMYSKHPYHIKKDRFFYKRIQTKKSIYIFFSAMALVTFFYSKSLFSIAVVLMTYYYLLQYVIIDNKFKKYPNRLLKFPMEFIVDLIRFYYSIKGCIKYRFFVIY